MKISSQAQLAMFTKAASDADYADSRGISQELAQQHLDAHKANGEPDLPPRSASDLYPRRLNKMSIFLKSQRN